MTKFKIPTVTCPRPDCKHTWVPRVANVTRCPKCFRPFPKTTKER